MNRKNPTWELIRYVFFGVMTTLVNLAVFFLCGKLLGSEWYLVSNVVAWVFAVVFAYVTNKLWVFESKSWERRVVIRELISFFAARIFSLLVEEAGLWLMIDRMGFDGWSRNILGRSVGGDTVAKLAMQFVVIVLNYVFSKLVVFKGNKENE